jgi:hypothetical protein
MTKTMATATVSIETPMPALTPLERPLGVEEAVVVVPALLVAVALLDANVLVYDMGMTVLVDSAADEASSCNISVSVLCHATGIPSFRTIRLSLVVAVTVISWYPLRKAWVV